MLLISDRWEDARRISKAFQLIVSSWNVFDHFRPGEQFKVLRCVVPGITWCCLTGDAIETVFFYSTETWMFVRDTGLTLGVLYLGYVEWLSSPGMEPQQLEGSMTCLGVCWSMPIQDVVNLWIPIPFCCFLILFDQLGIIWFFIRSKQTENGKGALACWELIRKDIVILGQSPSRIIFYIVLL